MRFGFASLCLILIPHQTLAQINDEENRTEPLEAPSSHQASLSQTEDQSTTSDADSLGISTPAPSASAATSGIRAFTDLLDTRKRQLISSYYLYRGPSPSEVEMAAALGAIDRLILQDYSLEDIWSTIFNILISEPELAKKPFELVVPPNIQKASTWRETATPVKVVIEERYPEFTYLYKRAERRQRMLLWGGAVAFIPAYTITIAAGTAGVGNLYNDALAWNETLDTYVREGALSITQRDDLSVDFDTGGAFLPLIPLLGPILTQSFMDTRYTELRDQSRDFVNYTIHYDPGTNLAGSVFATMLQTLGATALIIGATQKLPEPFEHSEHARRKENAVEVGISPNGAMLRGHF